MHSLMEKCPGAPKDITTGPKTGTITHRTNVNSQLFRFENQTDKTTRYRYRMNVAVLSPGSQRQGKY